MPKLNTYLTFNGTCEEAFEHYRAVFGGEFTNLQRFGDMPGGAGETNPEAIMHVGLPIGDDVLMGSDTNAAMGDVTMGRNFSISVSPDSREDADRIFQGLADGGNITMPMADTFWDAYFGMCVDRFGVPWMINYEAR